MYDSSLHSLRFFLDYRFYLSNLILFVETIFYKYNVDDTYLLC